MAKRELTHAERLLHGLQICSKYPEEFDHVSTGHDVIWAGPDPDSMTVSDRGAMLQLGWYQVFEYDCWGFST